MEGKSTAVMDDVKPKMKKAFRRDQDENQIEHEIWLKYKKKAGTIECRESLTELLDRHDGLLRKLACRMAVTYCRSGTFDDHLQNLRVGAIRGYDKFDPTKSESISLYISTVARQHAIDVARKNERPISVSSHVLTEARAISSYFNGDFDGDPEAKSKFELDHNLTSSEKIATALEKYRMLSPLFLSIEQHGRPSAYSGVESGPPSALEIPDSHALTEDEIIRKIDFERAKSQLSERANQVLRMSIEQESTDQEVADALNITTGKVRVDLRRMKSVLPMTLQDYSGD